MLTSYKTMQRKLEKIVCLCASFGRTSGLQLILVQSTSAWVIRLQYFLFSYDV